MPRVEAVLFDLDGVLVDTEPIWERVRRVFAEQHGGKWSGEIQAQMMGVRTVDWATTLSELIQRKIQPEAVADAVVSDLSAAYLRHLPVIDGAVDAARGLSRRFRLGLVSGSPLVLIKLILKLTDLTGCFEVAMSADDVAHGKPMPDPYLELARRMGVSPKVCAAVEDSANGIRSAAMAGARVIAIPRGDHRPDAETLRLASGVLPSITELTPDLVLTLGS